MPSAQSLQVTRLEREPISEQMVAQLLGMVRAGNLRAGDRLPSERELAESFGVSRPSIREAVRALAVLGVLKTHHGGGIYVSSLRAEELLGPLQFFLSLEETAVDALYDARELIEGGIAARAAGAATEESIAHLRDLIERQRAAIGEPQAYRKLDIEFHEHIHALAANPFLSRAATSLNTLGLEFRTMASESRQVIAQSLLDHAAIVTALAANDHSAAEHAMRLHMRNVLQSTRESLSTRHAAHKPPFQDPPS
ncbi:FadR/GntR family transcriptional regulator [Verminephrobacter aporrectodeae]|uniref:FadR/GntR family transcriptional regulator n=1 Tax=Verminephrobacter aporrectodeae TaxID=1110389 RepID=UPI00223768B2|nr:FadR/GntR family transcriptional regulator [Verminephrobacter aporrectodeae]MCW5257053.1 FadR family transcriptional regulator [Verminephrobacter aporrectodeae subsp. tuberculatae]MCW8173875.1 FadR family transcriptional regulator [Verminephrobacter aporrectodeae subsp. tuberculatae]MCW8201446.1 FadR family transcriptional regulator [Verminephrobacter aporrectodeae subsp. tuberculatae]MCW8206311.1 FadR family transcriptional regulator [Verminephrobacter aporrectodeae subsp. tuberculatae]